MAKSGLGAVLAVAVLGVSALAGCSARVGGEPVAATTISEPPEPTAENVLGDLSTIDPCSLTDPEAFESFGTTELATPESLDYCAISIEPSADVQVIISVGLLGELSDTPELESKKSDELDNGLYTARRDDSPGFCSQALVFVDEITLDVGSSTYQGDSPDTCPMVEAGMAKVLEVIDENGVKHREPEPDSLVSVDPCALVDDETVTALPGFAAAKRREYPAHHQCYWETSSDESRLSVRLVFGAGPQPTTWAPTGANSDPIAGRPSVTNPFPEAGTSAFCSVDSGHIPFEEVDVTEDIVELASVFVRTPTGQVDAGCQAAVAVATKVWPRLPTP
ncbi:MAG: DUF3558 domain-containing protein [Actinophytocola sp.]|uniref:DUF3558 family protein n=1 Tax=Actinophytocola sp. TaxID=1872138 RepID=UPI0013294E3A|nr:DUF3558 family protein [Actinophytocola sp.]MPZ82932.1 DUF3558 domain-containing protein [Actinophytocola sp.]